jgi:hypothetical protein
MPPPSGRTLGAGLIDYGNEYASNNQCGLEVIMQRVVV